MGRYQKEDPILMEKLNCAEYQIGYFLWRPEYNKNCNAKV